MGKGLRTGGRVVFLAVDALRRWFSSGFLFAAGNEGILVVGYFKERCSWAVICWSGVSANVPPLLFLRGHGSWVIIGLLFRAEVVSRPEHRHIP